MAQKNKINFNQIKLLHVAKRQTGMSEGDYRGVLGRVGVTTSKDLDKKGFEIVLMHFKDCGFTIKRATKKHDSKKLLISKIKAILTDLKLPDSYADGMSKKMFSVDKVTWCHADQLRRLVAALSYHQKRKSN